MPPKHPHRQMNRLASALSCMGCWSCHRHSCPSRQPSMFGELYQLVSLWPGDNREPTISSDMEDSSRFKQNVYQSSIPSRDSTHVRSITHIELATCDIELILQPDIAFSIACIDMKTYEMGKPWRAPFGFLCFARYSSISLALFMASSK